MILPVGGTRGLVPALLIGSFGVAAYLRALGAWAAGVAIRGRVDGAE